MNTLDALRTDSTYYKGNTRIVGVDSVDMAFKLKYQWIQKFETGRFITDRAVY